MLKKGGTHSFISKCIAICSTFLVVGIVLFNTMIPVSAALNYYTANDTVYKSADAYALEELPYGEDTGVVQIEYANNNYLTIYFDKLRIFDKYISNDDKASLYINNYYWDLLYDNSGSKLDYIFNCWSDSPIYYTLTYDSSNEFTNVISSEYRYHVADTLNSISYSYYISVCEDLKLSSIVPSDWYIDTNTSYTDAGGLVHYRSVYSNCYQYNVRSNGYYEIFPAQGYNVINPMGNVGYSIAYYPTCEYLQNLQIRSYLKNQWSMLMLIDDKLDGVLTELYSVNYFLSAIDDNVQYIYNDVSLYLPLIEYDLAEILAVLNEMKSGPEFDSSQGIGSNTEFGDAFGGLTQDTEIPNSDIGGIQSTLGNSFLFIRNSFDWINSQFNLGYVITFLLSMSFIAYVLGRVIKNKMNS